MVSSVTFPVYNLMYHQECLSEDHLNHPTQDWMLRTAVVTAVFAFRSEGGMTNYSNEFRNKQWCMQTKPFFVFKYFGTLPTFSITAGSP